MHDAEIGGTAPVTLVGLGNGTLDVEAVGEPVADGFAEWEGVGCEAELLPPQATTNITAAASQGRLRNRMRGAILLQETEVTE